MLCVERGYVVMLIRIVSIIFPLSAERYRQEPDKVASIVMAGNVAAPTRSTEQYRQPA